MFAKSLTLALFFVICITIDVMGNNHNQLAMNLNELPTIHHYQYILWFIGWIHPSFQIPPTGEDAEAEKEIEDVAERMYMLAKEHPGRKRDLPRAGLRIVVGYWACIPLISC